MASVELNHVDKVPPKDREFSMRDEAFNQRASS